MNLQPHVAFSILFALSAEPNHGYGLIAQIQNDSGGRIALGAGAMYTTLKKLAADGLIEYMPSGLGSERRKPYRLTKRGWDVLQQEVMYYEGISKLAKQRPIKLKP